jgi:hypothetical protein
MVPFFLLVDKFPGFARNPFKKRWYKYDLALHNLTIHIPAL